jgi:large subunit ribosomal protein L29
MQAREIRLLATEEIRERLDDAYRELFALRRELAMGRLEDYNRVEVVKRDIARMRTILRERELAAELVEEAV